MTSPEWIVGDEQLPLVHCMIRCVVPLLESESPQTAQAILSCINILRPQCDTRKLQGLAYYRMGQYSEALAVYADLDDMESRAFYALCQRAVGEVSWLGVAAEVKDSGDAAAIAIIDPWMAGGSDTEPPVNSLDAALPGYAYFPLRA